MYAVVIVDLIEKKEGDWDTESMPLQSYSIHLGKLFCVKQIRFLCLVFINHDSKYFASLEKS